jgi:hypothetical protein
VAISDGQLARGVRIICFLMKPVTRRLAVCATALACLAQPSAACCALSSARHHAVNADQSVIILWDEAQQRQHFIRKASFHSTDDDVGFLVPVPSMPELSESGESAFQLLSTITAPPPAAAGFPLGCAAVAPAASYRAVGVRVLAQQKVAGFDASVLAADSGRDLSRWLNRHGFSLSPAVATWAEPYIQQNWRFVALKLAKPDPAKPKVDASSLRLSFQTARPLFPYREPESATAARALQASPRLLRIYFIASRAHHGSLGDGQPWSGRTVWSGDISRWRTDLLALLKLPATTAPGTWWLTECEDRWAYTTAPGDLWFAPEKRNRTVRRPRIPTDLALTSALSMAGLCLLRRRFCNLHPSPSAQ